MRPKSLLLLALALGCGLIASLGISEIIDSRATSAAEPTVPVLVATVDIERGKSITAENVVVKQWPASTIPEGALRELAEIEDARAYTRITKDIPLTHSMLGGSMRAAEAIPDGYRPFNVRLNQEGGSIGLIKPGDRVDVLVFAKKNPAYGIQKTGVWTLLTDVEVFAKDSKIVEEEDADAGTSSQTQAISLLVTPEQVEKLALADELGKIRLTLRGSTEITTTADDQADLPAIFGGQAESVAALEQEMPDVEAIVRRIREEERKKYENMLAALQPPEPKRQVDFVMELWEGPRSSLMEFSPGELPTPRLPQDQPAPTAIENANTEHEPAVEPETPVDDDSVQGFEEDEASEGATADTHVKELVEEKIKEFFGAH